MHNRLIYTVGLLLTVAGAAVVADIVEVQPVEPYETTLDEAGWQPAQKVYELTNASNEWVYWQASNLQGRTTCDPAAGWVPPAGAASITIRPAAFMNLASAGTYTDEVTVDFDGRLLGDVDGDGMVNVIDLIRFVAVFGMSDSVCDFNGNGTVDIFDLIQLADNFGQSHDAMAI